MPDNEDRDVFGYEDQSWKQRLNEMLARGRLNDVIRFLDRLNRDGQLNLFEPRAALDSRRRLAWLYKINLLRSVGRIWEALAWACLECELCPENVEAQAIIR